MDRGINPHRNFIGVFSGNLLVHVEEVAVFFANDWFTHAADGVREVQVNAHAARPDPAPFIADFLGVARSDVAGNQVSETRVAPLEVIVALVFGNLRRGPRIALFLGTQTRPSFRSDSDMSVSLD